MPLSRQSAKPPPIRITQKAVSRPHSTAGSLTSAQIDLFEHAALLYHGYEWQAAVDAFDILSRNIDNAEEQVKCVLNAGMISARLGHYSRAASYFDEAVLFEPNLPIAYFLVALTSLERKDYDKAEACIESCLDGLDQEGIDYAQLGLNFVLNRSALIRGLREIRTAQYHARAFSERDHIAVRLDSIPAECIFEAPPRLSSSPDYAEHSARSHTRLRRSTRIGKSSESTTHVVKATGPVNDPESSHSQRNPRLPSLPLDYDLQGLPEISEESEESDGTLTSVSVSPRTNEAILLGPISAAQSKHRTWHRRPSTPFTPRDARVASDSVRELARFIRNEGRSKPLRSLVPKDAKGEYESVEELTRFVQLYSPTKENIGALTPLDLDAAFIADLQTHGAINQQKKRQLISPGFNSVVNKETSSDAPSPVTQEDQDSRDLYQHHAVFADSDNPRIGRGATLTPKARPILDTPSPSSASENGMPDVEVLQPAVYQPPALRKQKKQTPSVRTVSPVRDAKDEMTPSTPASRASSFYRGSASFDRRIRARQNALKLLEGRSSGEAMNLYTSKGALPSPPDDCTTASSIDTVDFFSKVLERNKTSRM